MKMPALPEVDRYVYDESGLMLSASEEAAVERLLLAYGLAVAEACAAKCDEMAAPLDPHKWPSPIACADAIREMASAAKPE